MQYEVSQRFYDIVNMLVAQSLESESSLEYELAMELLDNLVVM